MECCTNDRTARGRGAPPTRHSSASGDGDLLVVVGAHYDDGAFSVGGIVHRHVRLGGRAVVATVFGGAPADEQHAGAPLARALHERWASAGAGALTTGASPPVDGEIDEMAKARAIVDMRRREDAAALEALGAAQHAMAFPDCIYRRVGGSWRCAVEADLFGSTGPDEPDLRAAVTGAVASIADGATLVLAPLGLGGHVDHALVHSAVRRLPNVGYYEDVPYSLSPSGWARRLVRGLRPLPLSLDAADLEARERAASCYASQWPTFWPDAATMAAELRRAARSGWRPGVWCETVWLAPDSPLAGWLADRPDGWRL